MNCSNTSLYSVKKNNGSDGNLDPNGSALYSNQCMWLSIIDYLNNIQGQSFNLDEIRLIASSNNTRINGPKEQFDTDIHIKSLINVTNILDLQVHLYVTFRNKNNIMVISNEPNWIIGNRSSTNVVSIVSYGGHFELITSIGTRNLYQREISSQGSFVPNRDLALGTKITTVSSDQLEKIDAMLEISHNLDRVAMNLKQQIEKNKIDLDNLKESLEISDVTDEQFQITIITSFQEHQMFLEKILSDLTKEFDDIKNHSAHVEEELDKLIRKY
jgi:hypothetical protein